MKTGILASVLAIPSKVSGYQLSSVYRLATHIMLFTTTLVIKLKVYKTQTDNRNTPND